LIECFIGKIKHFRRIFSRFDKLDGSYSSFLHFVGALIWQPNRHVSERLFVALDTVKGHNRNIYQKLQVKRRTDAVARACELGLI